MGCGAGKHSSTRRPPPHHHNVETVETDTYSVWMAVTDTYSEWMAVTKVPKHFLPTAPRAIKDTAKRGMSLKQLEVLGSFVGQVLNETTILDRDSKRQEWHNVHLYTVCDYIVKPLTRNFRCSFAELVAVEEQIPRWFVSHFWGTPFRQTLRMLALHSRGRGLAESTFYYWVCTFANNQHDLTELGGGLEATPFVRVLRSATCTGTVALMDQHATPFRRVWCVLECYESTMRLAAAGKREHLYDLAAWVPEGEQFIDDVGLPGQAVLQLDMGRGSTRDVAEGDGWFPASVAAQGIKTEVRSAVASRDDDKELIMEYIDGREDELNTSVRQRFAHSAMMNMARDGDVEKILDLLKAFPDSVHEADDYGRTPAYLAAQEGHAEALRALVEARADLDKADHDGWTPAFAAVNQGHAEVLRVLVEARADLDKASNDGWTPARVAAAKGHAEALRVLA